MSVLGEFVSRSAWRPLSFARPGDLPAGGVRSPLTRRIIFFNAVALIILIAGVMLVQAQRVSLVDERLSGVRQQARVIASTLAEFSANEERRAINLDEAEPLLRQLVSPTQLRARLYGTDGRLEIDTRNLLARNIVEISVLPPIDFWSRMRQQARRLYDGVMGVRPFADLAPYFEAGEDGRVYSEVNAALSGDTATGERVDEHNRLVLSVAVPVQRLKAVYGVLMVSTEGGDIDVILRSERTALLEVFFVALIVMLLSSLYLAGFIAEPIRKLAAAADRVRHGRVGREAIPPMSDRRDEIGDLASSLSAMTKALHDRIDAIESFAADVAHELKNPLTSLSGAVEMLNRAKDDQAREKWIGIVRNDVRRIDRLISDISDASRLDAELSRETAERVDVKHLLATIADIYGAIGLPRDVSLKLDTDADGVTVIGRDERLGQVVRNLIDNAVSFSPDGGVVTLAAHAADGRARIVIEDEGAGIPPENLETVFNRFYTSRPSEHGFGKNSGLGLSIARQIVTGMEGRVWAENRDDKGACFIVELPLAKP